MKRMAVFCSLVLLLQTTTVLANEIDRDPFTTFVQEILIDLGLLDTPATGVNDKATQKAIMSFQEKAGLEKIDGIVGGCLLYTSPSPRDISGSRMPSSA